MIDYSRLQTSIERQFALPLSSIHGPAHWARVETFGLRIAKHSGANPAVVRLFALFHDARRHTDGGDPRHGERGAELAAQLRGQAFELDDEAFAQLTLACQRHSKGQRSDDPTIGTCWDADRLDLPRAGIIPATRFLSTEAARRPALLDWAVEVSLRSVGKRPHRRGKQGRRRR